jgi:hypothetical protein
MNLIPSKDEQIRQHQKELARFRPEAEAEYLRLQYAMPRLLLIKYADGTKEIRALKGVEQAQQKAPIAGG